MNRNYYDFIESAPWLVWLTKIKRLSDGSLDFSWVPKTKDDETNINTPKFMQKCRDMVAERLKQTRKMKD